MEYQQFKDLVDAAIMPLHKGHERIEKTVDLLDKKMDGLAEKVVEIQIQQARKGELPEPTTGRIPKKEILVAGSAGAGVGASVATIAIMVIDLIKNTFFAG